MSAALISAPAVTAQTLKLDSATMGAGYANQIFYDMKNGNVGSALVSNWDIAHTTDPRSACIRANHMNGIEIMAYPKNGTAGWASFDTTGWKTWRKRFNDLHIHDFGAFSQVSNHPKYDWATYDANTHVLNGDSLYLIAWSNGMGGYTKFLKFWPVKQPTTTDLIFKYANVDGSNEVTDTLYQSAANNQNYKYYSFATKAKPVREPAKNTWDITFNRYYEPQYDPGSGKVIPYPTMGVESNNGTNGTRIARLIGPSFATVLADSHDLARKNYPTNFKVDLTAIGSNWKKYDQPNNKYLMKDTQSYIIKSVRSSDTSYWLIHFTGFTGGSQGKTLFNLLQLRGNNVSVKNAQIGSLNVFPNPASQMLYISLENTQITKATVSLNTLNGATLRTMNVNGLSDFNALNMPLTGIAPGVYLISIQSGDNAVSQKVIIQ